MPSIKITINSVGMPVIEAMDFVDGACATATAPLISALAASGEKETEVVHKPEYHNQIDQEEHTHVEL